MHAITKTTTIKMYYLKINTNDFIKENIYSTAESKFERYLANPAGRPPKISVSKKKKKQLDKKKKKVIFKLHKK